VLAYRIRAAVLTALGTALLIAPASAGAVNPVSFSQVGNLTTPRDAPGAALLPDGRVLVAGGYDGDSLDTAEIFDPKTNSFTAIGATMSTVRYAPGAASLPDGRVLIAGGWNDSNDLTSAEVFDPSTGTFSPVGSMSVPRELPGTASLPDGRVLVVGGYAESDATATTEIFDPRTNTFTPGPNMAEQRWAPAVAAISGGRVLIAGGEDGVNDLASSEILNTSSGIFSPGGSLPSPTRAAAGASLPQGRALVAGGEDDLGNDLTRALIFDPATSAFSSAGIGNLIHERQEPAAVELTDGRVLVVGGWDGAAVDTAEVLSVPSNAFTAKLKGRKVKFAVTNEGVAQVTDIKTQVVTTAAKKKKKKKPKLVKTTSKPGGPGKIVVKVKLTKAGAAKLAQKGKLRIRVVYTPDQGLSATKKLKLRARK
jgi:WD40 repeat protein